MIQTIAQSKFARIALAATVLLSLCAAAPAAAISDSGDSTTAVGTGSSVVLDCTADDWYTYKDHFGHDYADRACPSMGAAHDVVLLLEDMDYL
jgi:hypothetical protein